MVQQDFKFEVEAKYVSWFGMKEGGHFVLHTYKGGNS